MTVLSSPKVTAETPAAPAEPLDPIPARLGIVPALDLDTIDELKRVVEATCAVPGVVEYKLGLSAVLHVGFVRGGARHP